jgi:iron-sulfur cluster assembly protein
MITVTEKAKSKIEALRKDANIADDFFLRVAVQGGGCSGLSYKLDFDNEIKKGDQEFDECGYKIVLDMKSFLYLAGTELDFSDGLNGKGFNFINPNASRTCGCGESFSV